MTIVLSRATYNCVFHNTTILHEPLATKLHAAQIRKTLCLIVYHSSERGHIEVFMLWLQHNSGVPEHNAKVNECMIALIALFTFSPLRSLSPEVVLA